MRTDEFISRLGPKADPKRNGNGWMVRCPAHDDRTGSLSVGEGRDGRILLHCHAGCKVEAICEAKGIALADLMPETDRKVAKRIVATYPYHDEDGKLLFEVVRYDPKGFSQRRPDPTGKDGWIWNMKGVRRVLYRLPDLLSAVFAEHNIYITEGEKDVDALRAHGFAATCNSGGAGKWLDTYNESLRGASVVIIADKDRSGRTHAGAVARLLQGFANSVKILELPDVNGKPVKDAAAFFAAGGEPMDLQELAHAAPFWTPKTQLSFSDS
jgi:5S rRNA maturation endonuclease (ribonuclease M5)